MLVHRYGFETLINVSIGVGDETQEKKLKMRRKKKKKGLLTEGAGEGKEIYIVAWHAKMSTKNDHQNIKDKHLKKSWQQDAFPTERELLNRSGYTHITWYYGISKMMF